MRWNKNLKWIFYDEFCEKIQKKKKNIKIIRIKFLVSMYNSYKKFSFLNIDIFLYHLSIFFYSQVNIHLYI